MTILELKPIVDAICADKKLEFKGRISPEWLPLDIDKTSSLHALWIRLNAYKVRIIESDVQKMNGTI